MVKNDDSTPATKGDSSLLRRELHGDMDQLRRELREEIVQEGEETRRHFDVVAEKLHHGFLGAFGDRTAQHDDKLVNLEHRMQRVERKVGLAA